MKHRPLTHVRISELKTKRVSDPIQVWRLHRTVTTVEAIEVRAKTRAQAEKAATYGVGTPVGEPKVEFQVIQNWPADEPEEFEIDLENGYRVRRGWFWEVRLDYRTISFLPDLVDPCNYGVTRDSFRNLVGANDTIYGYSKRYGWAASQGGMSTWSKLHDNARDAYKDCRAYVMLQQKRVNDLQRFHREQAEALMIEDLIDVLVVRMRANSDKLTRLDGGKWITEDATIGTDNQPDVFEDKRMIDRLLNAGLIEVTDRMNKSGDPRVVRLTASGIERAERAARVPEFLR